jgi:hypothetical protein
MNLLDAQAHLHQYGSGDSGTNEARCSCLSSHSMHISYPSGVVTGCYVLLHYCSCCYCILQLLLEKLAEAWEVTVDTLPGDVHQPGTHRCTCPSCGNGKTGQDSGFAVTVDEDNIVWCCHRATCGYRGGVSVRGGARADSSDVEAALGAVTAAARQGPAAGPLRDAGSAAVIRDEQQKVRKPGAFGFLWLSIMWCAVG